MQTIFSTADVPQAEAFDYWMDIACANFARHEAEPLDRRGFSAELRMGTVADLNVWHCRMAAETARLGGTDTNDLQLLVPRRHRFRFGDRRFEIDGSDLILFDTREASVVQTLDPVSIGLRIPRDALTQRIRQDKRVVNHPIAEVGDAVLLAAFVRDLIRIGPSTLSPATATIVREQMIDLTAVVLGNLAGTMPRLGAAARFSTLKLRVFIESQLTNPDADAQSIAAGAGVSESHANRLLALEGTSIRRLLIERRLNKCREMIEDPRHVHRSISDIAFFYGFRNLSHFTRVFKGRFGLSPSEHRSAFDPVGH